MRNFIVRTLSTFFGIGYLPLIPGTFASIAGLILFYLVRNSIFLYTLITLTLLVLGFGVSGTAEEVFNRKDARCIVLDEIGGMLLSLAFIPYNIRLTLIAFVVFRILDAFKPPPAGRIQKLKGSMGIMGDDIVAGLYTNLILQVVIRCASFKLS